MNSYPTHRYFGTQLDEWICRVPNELEHDDISLWQIVAPLRHDFGLQGHQLRVAVEKVVYLLVARGAVPVSGGDNPDSQGLWASLQDTSSPLQHKIMKYIDNLGRDPDSRDIWMSLP